VSVPVSVANSPPDGTLTASDGTIYEGESVELEVESLSDPDGDTVDIVDWKYNGAWQGETATTQTLSFPESAGPTGTSSYTETVAVKLSDGSDTVTRSVDITVENRPPVAKLTADTTATASSSTTVSLDGSESYDLDTGDESGLTYSWSLVDSPSGSSASVGSSGETQTLSGLDTPGRYTVELTVTDTDGASASTQAMVAVGSSSASSYTPLDVSVVEINLEDD
jgi:PKD repeat protein